MALTTDPSDPRLGHGPDDVPTGQNQAYLIANDAVRHHSNFIRPVRTTYVHVECGGTTSMSRKIAETYALNPKFYGATYCIRCAKHLPVDEFRWADDDQVVGS